MRPDRDSWAMALAVVTSQRSTCLRRQVGCVLVHARGHVLSTGYNGVAAGQKHCNEHTHTEWVEDKAEQTGIKLIKMFSNSCKGAQAKSGTNLDSCHAIHAEQNALLQCRDVYSIETVYVTASPCMTCTKLLLNTSCKRIVFLDVYPHNDAENLWVNSGRQWCKLDFKYTLTETQK